MLSTLSTPKIKTGTSALSGIATRIFPYIPFTAYVSRETVMFSVQAIEKQLEGLPDEEGAPALALFRSLLRGEDGIVQEKYRGFKRIYPANLFKTLTVLRLRSLADEFNRLSSTERCLGVNSNGQFVLHLPIEATQDMTAPELRPMSLEIAVRELFNTEDEPLSLVDVHKHLEGRGVEESGRQFAGIRIGQWISEGWLCETVDNRFYLASKQGELSSNKKIRPIFTMEKPKEVSYVTSDFLRENPDQKEIRRFVHSRCGGSFYMKESDFQLLRAKGTVVPVLAAKGRGLYCYKKDISQLAKGDTLRREQIVSNGEEQTVLIYTRAYQSYVDGIFEFHLKKIQDNLGDTSATTASLLRRSFKVGWGKSGTVGAHVFKANAVSCLTKDPFCVAAALMADVKLAKLEAKLKRQDFPRKQRIKLRQGLESYHLVRRIPFHIPRKRVIYYMNNFMDEMAYLSGRESGGKNPIGFVLFFAEKLESHSSPRVSGEEYSSYKDSLRFMLTIFAERCGQRDFANEARNIWLKKWMPKEFDRMRAEMQDNLGMSLEEADEFLENSQSRLYKELVVRFPKIKIKPRRKNEYCCYEKSTLRDGHGKYPVSEFMDIMGMRFVVSSEQELYALSGILARYKNPDQVIHDDVAQPRESGWRAFTIPAICDGKHVEIQIMTPDMLEEDKTGVAAHWKKRALEESKSAGLGKRNFDTDPSGIVDTDLAVTFGNLWEHVSQYTRVFNIGENKKIRDAHRFANGLLEANITRMPRNAYPADVASDRPRDLFQPVRYAGVSCFEFYVDQDDNNIRVRFPTNKAKPAENFLVPSGSLVSVMLGAGGYLTEGRLDQIGRLDPPAEYRTRYLAYVHRIGMTDCLTWREEMLEKAKSMIREAAFAPDLSDDFLWNDVCSTRFLYTYEFLISIYLRIYPLDKAIDLLGLRRENPEDHLS